ncbi:MAG: DUF3416 domain-containing protein, partial [Saprospiraceae bacterium]|nr:DUF3416 domain-containing protein [Saprospiraceae bacterium]
MRNRVLIEHIQPQLDGGRYFIKRTVGEPVNVSADIFGDGHDHIRAALLYKPESKKRWNEVVMEAQGNDRWTATFVPEEQGFYEYKIEGWVDHLLNWYEGFKKKHDAGQHLGVELLIGAELLKKTAAQYPKSRNAQLLKLAKLLEDEKGYQEAVATIMGPDFAALVDEFPLKQF